MQKSDNRLNSTTIFKHYMYVKKMNVESVIYAMKSKFNGEDYSGSTSP